MPFVQALILIIVANAAPVALTTLLLNRPGYPLDFDVTLPDGRPLLGPSKTLRGSCAAVLACGIAALVLGYPLVTGLKAGGATMLGDLLSSFTKRRLGRPSSSRATGLDQVPESLFPALVLAPDLGLGFAQVLAIVLVFFVLEVIVSPVLYRLGLRKTPW